MMNSSYNLVAKFMQIMDLSIFGEGAMKWELYDVTLDMTTWLELRDGKVYAKSVASKVALDSNLFYADGIYNSDFYSVIISDLVTSWLPYVVDNYPWVIVDPINEKSVEAINSHYQNATLQDVINAIGAANS